MFRKEILKDLEKKFKKMDLDSLEYVRKAIEITLKTPSLPDKKGTLEELQVLEKVMKEKAI